ncbi:MAG TPA: hypothetical protein DC009_01890 [Porphyromonadaceae bacterium]|nr:hypothetical protein [Porphyromonadaceae bacterium]
MKLRIPAAAILAALMLLPAADGAARRVKVPASSPKTSKQNKQAATKENSFAVDSLAEFSTDRRVAQCSLAQVTFRGFDKPVESRVETFFVTNAAPYRLTRLTVRMDYFGSDGEKMHSRKCVIDCDIPAGEQRQVSVPSFDRQQTYRYQHSRVPPRRTASTFTVRLTAVRLVFTDNGTEQ